VFMVNTCWLLPIAVLVALDYIDGFMALLIAYLPLIGLSIKFKAGRVD